jgi:hypothetical protein
MELSTTRKAQLCGHLIFSQHFKEPEISIPNSQELFACSYPEPDQSSQLLEVEVTLRLTVWLGVEHPCGTCNQILLPVGMLLSESCGFVSVGREDGSAVCSAVAQWSKSRRTRNHILKSHLRLPNRFLYLYPSGTGWSSYIPRHWVPFTLSLATRRATVEVF